MTISFQRQTSTNAPNDGFSSNTRPCPTHHRIDWAQVNVTAKDPYLIRKDRNGHFLSQSGEDFIIIESFFNGLCGGRYLEMGGLDGKRFSNTHALHSLLNWQGVLVELNPRHFKKLRVNRPDDVTVNAAVCARERVVHWVAGHGKGSATEVDGIWELAPPSFRQKWWSHVVDLKRDTTPIECMPLQKVLDRHYSKLVTQQNQTHTSLSSSQATATPTIFFDLFSLDIEGAELEALESLDFSRTAFGVILVEADEHFPAKNRAVQSLLQKHGYHYLYDLKRSSWFVHSDWDNIYREQLSMVLTTESQVSD